MSSILDPTWRRCLMIPASTLLFDKSPTTKTGTTTGRETVLSIHDAEIEMWTDFDWFIRAQLSSFSHKNIDVPIFQKDHLLAVFKDEPFSAEIASETGITNCIYAKTTNPISELVKSLAPDFKIDGQDSVFTEYQSLRKRVRDELLTKRKSQKNVNNARGRVPDGIVMRDNRSRVAMPMEFKTCWAIKLHRILDAIRNHVDGQNDDFEAARVLEHLAQPVDYMLYTGCKYSCLSTYEETVFLKLERMSDGRAKISVSPVVHYRTSRNLSTGPAILQVDNKSDNKNFSHCTMREAFFGMALFTSQAGPSEYQWEYREYDSGIIRDPLNGQEQKGVARYPPTPHESDEDEVIAGGASDDENEDGGADDEYLGGHCGGHTQSNVKLRSREYQST